MCEGEGVVDEEGDTTPTPSTAAAVEECVAGDVEIGRRTKFRFLNGDDGDSMFVEKLPELVDFSKDSIAVPLEDFGKRRRDGAGTRIRVNSGDDEETREEGEEEKEREASRNSAPARWPMPTHRRKPDDIGKTGGSDEPAEVCCL